VIYCVFDNFGVQMFTEPKIFGRARVQFVQFGIEHHFHFGFGISDRGFSEENVSITERARKQACS